MPDQHLDQNELSQRWRMSPRTLEKWRWQRQGPVYIKVGGHVVYRLEDVEAYERDHQHFMDGSPPLIVSNEDA